MTQTLYYGRMNSQYVWSVISISFVNIQDVDIFLVSLRGNGWTRIAKTTYEYYLTNPRGV